MLAPEDARLLERVTLGGGTATSPAAAGMRRARARGAGIEFHEFRRYQPGDDIRSIDWTVEARLRQLVVRVSRADGHLRLHVLIDASASMSLGRPTKLSCAQRVAAALCVVAEAGRDVAGVSVFRDRLDPYLPPAGGRGQLFKAFEVLAALEPRGRADISGALRQYAAAASGPGLVVVLSDYFEPGAGIPGLQALLHRRLTPAVVQVVSRDDLAHDVPSDTELVDIEDPHGRRIVIDEAMVAAYRMRLAEHDASLETFCAAHGLPLARVVSDMSFREVLGALEGSGLLGMRV